MGRRPGWAGCAGQGRRARGQAVSRAALVAHGRGEGGRRERERGGKKREKGKRKRGRGRERELAENSAAIATGGRAWATGSRATRDGTAARKKMEGTVGGKDGTMIEIGHQDGGNSGRGLGLTGSTMKKF